MNELDLALEGQLAHVRELYAELFMLMLQSIAEDPLESATGAVDASIENLMRSIEGNMAGLRRAVDRTRGAGGPEPELAGAVAEFEAQLRDGLGSMSEQVRLRTETLARERETLKSSLQLVQRRRSGTRGYRAPGSSYGTIIESQA